ncbi:MAG TPA: T9SS type A sorting domain-containing protein [Bacteroides sp.]|nr:T9SS type A sorting domain-containing protein [Bacteroides sp.]
MKKRFTLILLCTVFAMGAIAQKPTAVINKASVAPVIDGEVDGVWTEAPLNNIDQNYTGQVPTLGPSGTTTWQGLWTEEGMYVILIVNDDSFYPYYAVDPPGETWQYDKTELYFDVNYFLEDGGGPLPDWVGGGNGHYQIEPAFTEGSNDGTLMYDTRHDGVEYAFMVNDPDYVAEYFVPFSALKNNEGGPIDPTGEIGFDVYVIDRDPGDTGERNAVWANTGTTESSWNSMDDCGIITFEGAVAPVYIDEISLTGGEINENNGKLQIQATVVPEDNTETLTWTVTDGVDGGRAKVNKNGVVTAVLDGTVTVTASSLYVDASVDVTISNQIMTMPEINLIRNGYFDEVSEAGTALEWSGNRPVIDGAVMLDPPPGGVNVWDYTMAQQHFGCNTTDQYWFTFVAKADEPDTFNVDFEDPNQDYLRYGTSMHEFSNGTCDWTFITETEWTKYVFDVMFVDMIENTIESLNFMLGWHDPVVYIDSIILYNENDLARLTEEYIPVESITVTSESGENMVSIGASLQMDAEVLPADANLTDVNWSVVPGTGYATIDASGLLTGDTAGMVTVVASAKDDSKVWNVMEIYVTWPEGIQQHSVDLLQVYPNPAVDELNVVLTNVNTTVSIYNSMGQKVEEVTVSGNKYRFDISSYASGLYFVKSDGSIRKFVK